MAKIIIYQNEAQQKILNGVSKLAKAVSVTMGPRGKNVMIGKPVGAPVITKDGVSVAREVVLDDPIEELASKLVKEVAGKTATLAGDGTTTATVLTDEIMTRSQDLIKKGVSPIVIRDGLFWTAEKIKEELKNISLQTSSKKDLINIATVSTNNDKVLGEVIGTAYSWAGQDGTVAAQAHHGVETKVEKIDGITLHSGFSSLGFLGGESKSEIVLERCKILIANRKISNLVGCDKLLKELNKKNYSLLIISKGVEKEALRFLVGSNKSGMLNVCAINFPQDMQTVDARDDLSILTSSRISSDAFGLELEDVTLEDLGSADKIVVDRFSTQIFNSAINKDRQKKKVADYKHDLQQPISDSEKLELKKRISFLGCEGAMITIGYKTELELKEKGDRVEDAMHATYAAVTEGIVPGGGAALIHAANAVSDMEIPHEYLPVAQTLIDACVRPLKQILSNAGMEHSEIFSKIISSDNKHYGYNVITGNFENLIETGIVDPLKVTMSALENAVSVSSVLINTDAVLAERPDNPSEWQPPAGWRPPSGAFSHKY